MQDRDTHLDYAGAQIPLVAFDELTEFLAPQFWFMFSRNRSVSGVRPYIRATCNPDADSWVADLLAWWMKRVSGPEVKILICLSNRPDGYSGPQLAEAAGYTFSGGFRNYLSSLRTKGLIVGKGSEPIRLHEDLT